MKRKWTDWKGVKSADWYWWWNGDEDAAPVVVSILSSGHKPNQTFFASMGQLGWNRPQDVSEMGGHWSLIKQPEIPQ